MSDSPLPDFDLVVTSPVADYAIGTRISDPIKVAVLVAEPGTASHVVRVAKEAAAPEPAPANPDSADPTASTKKPAKT